MAMVEDVKGGDAIYAWRAMNMLDQFRRYDPDIPVQAMYVFLAIAVKPGISLKEIERGLNMPTSTVSRLVLYLSIKHWKKDEEGQFRPGLNLVETRPSPFNQRVRVARVTTLGRTLYERVVHALKGASSHGG